MRMLIVLLLALSADAATLTVEVNRNGFSGPIEVAVAPRVEGNPPVWSMKETLPAGKSSVAFADLGSGLYIVIARGPQPLQRLSAKANVGAKGGAIRLVIPKSKASVRTKLAGQPLADAEVTLTHDELRWDMQLETDDKGRFEGALWEPGVYTAAVRKDRAAAPHYVDVTFAAEPVIIDVPDRHVSGHVMDDAGKPLAGALVMLQTESNQSTLTVRTTSALDGAFTFFGVREGAHSLSARAPSYVHSDASVFELRGASAKHSADLRLTRGTQRAVRVIDERGGPIANATLYTACNGYIKSTLTTDADGRANVAVPASAACAIYALPKEGSIAVGRIEGTERIVIRVPDGSSSLRLALKSEAGAAFSDLWLLMRVDGMVVPPPIARILGARGFSLVTDDEGTISLAHIPPGTYEFWPYRNEAEGRMIYEVAGEFAAPISVNVTTGENEATVKFKARR
ncbi:MAG TPA: carboxypeptidase regulatory-like domain-containing protein [Thermoanaerobaculia bacterium]|jgi:hypothetical protein|nr:carboxypeptidase regulatory-like domain-containing protein [Thermoanaerobaculia bacterium]